MAEIIAIIILLVSFSGIVAICLKKAPLLSKLPPSKKSGSFCRILGIRLWQKINFAKHWQKEKILQVFFSKIKVLALKIETKSEKILQALRQDLKAQKDKPNSSYWQELKRAKKKGKIK